MIDALSRVRNPTLLLGGTADAMWKADAIPTTLPSRSWNCPTSITPSKWRVIPSPRSTLWVRLPRR